MTHAATTFHKHQFSKLHHQQTSFLMVLVDAIYTEKSVKPNQLCSTTSQEIMGHNLAPTKKRLIIIITPLKIFVS